MKRAKRLLAVIVCGAILVGTSTNARANEAYEGGGGQTKFVALTFDDGPTGKLTERLLDGLKERYVSVTFFLCGYRIEQFPDVVCDMAADGHELGIHGQTHAYLHKMSQQEVQKELEQTSRDIEQLTGQKPHLFRPPGGLTSDALLREARLEELPIILWTIDPEDWKCHDVNCVVKRITGKVKDGDIILMHDLSQASVTAAFRVIDELERRGFEFCTVSELAQIRGVALTPAESYLHFPT